MPSAASSSRKRVRRASDSPSTSLAPLYDSYADKAFSGRYDDDLGVYEDEDDEEEEEEVDYDDEVDDDGDDMDGVIVTTPSKSRKRGEDSPFSTPDVTPSRRRDAAKRKQRTPRKTTIHIDPSAPGFVRPTAADAYFLAAARPRRKGIQVSGTVDGAKLTNGKKRRKVDADGDGGVDDEAGEENGLMVKKTITLEERQAASKAENELQYAQWENELLNGYNLIFFGHGSKRLLLDDLVATRLEKLGHCMVINGLYPGLTIKDVLLEIEMSFSDIKSCPISPDATTALEKAASRIYAYFLPEMALPNTIIFPTSTKPLFLVLNNIDSPGLRTPKSLAVLSLLAASPRIHIVTSFDHVNTPILFSTTATTTPKHNYPTGSWAGTPLSSRGFSWAWHNATTFAPYTLEIEYAKQATVFVVAGGAGGETVTEEGALRVLHSVTTNARRLFKLLLQRQIAAIPESAEADDAVLLTLRTSTAPTFAMDGDLLQKTAREKMIATQEERFNALMGEFKDHGLVVEFGTQEEGGRGRWTWVPLGRGALVRLVESMHDVDD
jgi:origin recognition complex subunit 2